MKFTNDETLLKLLETCEKYRTHGIERTQWKSKREIKIRGGLVMGKLKLADYVKKFLIDDNTIKVFNVSENKNLYGDLTGVNVFIA